MIYLINYRDATGDVYSLVCGIVGRSESCLSVAHKFAWKQGEWVPERDCCFDIERSAVIDMNPLTPVERFASGVAH